MAFFQIALLSIVLAATTIHVCSALPVGFSYAKFSGPVSGPEKEVYVHDKHTGHGHIDYIAKPDYHFAYGVEDPKSKVQQNRKETRSGDAVTGEYSVVDPDGTLRVVKYTADKINGFQAEIITNGHSEQYGHGHSGSGSGTGSEVYYGHEHTHSPSHDEEYSQETYATHEDQKNHDHEGEGGGDDEEIEEDDED